MPLMLNTVHLAGNLTRDPVVKVVGDQRTVANFGLAINRRFRTSSGEQKEETTFVEIECWGRQAELVGQYMTKGRNVMIEGSLRLDQWENKEGQKRSQLRVQAQRVHFVGGAPGQSSQSSQESPSRVAESGYSEMPAMSQASYEDEPPF